MLKGAFSALGDRSSHTGNKAAIRCAQHAGMVRFVHLQVLQQILVLLPGVANGNKECAFAPCKCTLPLTSAACTTLPNSRAFHDCKGSC